MTRQLTEAETEEKIEEMAEIHEVPAENVAEKVSALAEEFEERFSNPRYRAVRKVANDLRGSQMADPEPMRGMVVGCSDPINTTTGKVNDAKEFINNQGLKKAVKSGVVRRAKAGGEIPDGVATIKVKIDGETEEVAVMETNEASPNSGEALPERDMIRYVHVAAWRQGDAEPTITRGVVEAEERMLDPPKPPLFEPVQFRAVWVGESDDSNAVDLRYRDPEPFDVLDDGPDPESVFADLGLVNLESATADRFGRNDFVVTTGAVAFMSLSPEGDQSRRLSINDPMDVGDDLVTVWLPDHVEVDFGQDSEIYVVGRVSPASDPQYTDSIQAVGVWPDPAYKTAPTDIEPLAGDEEDEPEATDADFGGLWDDPEPEGDGDHEAESDASESEEEEATAAADGGVTEEDRGDFQPDEADGDFDWD